MGIAPVTNIADIPPRISALGNDAVGEIAMRCNVSKAVVMRAMLLTSLRHQGDLMSLIEALRGQEIE